MYVDYNKDYINKINTFNMRFVIITKQELQKIPPLISVAYILNDLGHSVHIISCGITDRIREELSKRGITSEEFEFVKAKKWYNKIIEYSKFRYCVNKRLKTLQFDFLWIEAGYTIRALGNIINEYKYILQLSELHEGSKSQLKAIGKIINKAQLVFMPEYNRTCIYRAWFRLEKSPIVLPNKPYYLPSHDSLEQIKVKYTEKLSVFYNSKVILFQGRITEDRDLSFFARAVNKLGNDYRLVLMGSYTELVEKYKALCPSLIHIDFVTPPDYLLFTSLCHIGIISYNPIILNNAFCAPNKIYEYSAYGKPILGNNIPGLKVLEYNGFGAIIDEYDTQSIIDGIKVIEADYNAFSNNAVDFFQKCRNDITIKHALTSLMG